METLTQHLSSLSAETGSGLRAAVQSSAVLRDWIALQLAFECDIDFGTAGAAVDRWCEKHPPAEATTYDQGTSGRDGGIEALVRNRRSNSYIDEAVEFALLDTGFGGTPTQMGNPFDTIARFVTARDVFLGRGNVVDAAACDMKLAVIASGFGWHRTAHDLGERARTVIARHGSVGDFARFLEDQATLQQALGAIAQETDLREKARWLAYEAEEMGTFASATQGLARCAFERGDLDGAIDLLFEARDVYVDLGDPQSTADCDLLAGVAMTESGNYEDGFTAARQALAVFVEYEQPIEAAQARRAIAHSLDHLGKHDAALEELEKARVALEDLGLRAAVAECDLDRSNTLRALGRFSDAASVVIEVRRAFREIGRSADDRWFDETLAAIARGEVDAHDHPIVLE